MKALLVWLSLCYIRGIVDSLSLDESYTGRRRCSPLNGRFALGYGHSKGYAKKIKSMFEKASKKYSGTAVKAGSLV